MTRAGRARDKSDTPLFRGRMSPLPSSKSFQDYEIEDFARILGEYSKEPSCFHRRGALRRRRAPRCGENQRVAKEARDERNNRRSPRRSCRNRAANIRSRLMAKRPLRFSSRRVPTAKAQEDIVDVAQIIAQQVRHAAAEYEARADDEVDVPCYSKSSTASVGL